MRPIIPKFTTNSYNHHDHQDSTMGNFASSMLCGCDDSIDSIHDYRKVSAGASFTTTLAGIYHHIINSLSGSSVVISELDEAWYQDLLHEVDMKRARHARVIAAAEFLGPADTTVESLNLSAAPHKPWTTTALIEDDSSSDTADETDDESKCDYSDSDTSEYGDDDECCCPSTQLPEVEYYLEDDDTQTKADRLLRLSSMSFSDDAPQVYVDDYLCPCGECPQYARIACDVRATVTWRHAHEQRSIIRVLQAFSTYNEVIGYRPEMIEAAEECLQLWLGDEDRALHSFVMLYDEVPQLCSSPL
jgi:hypothetical protein